MNTREIAKESFLLGFMLSREGYNAECAYDHCCDGLQPGCGSEDYFREMMAESEPFQKALKEALARLIL